MALFSNASADITAKIEVSCLGILDLIVPLKFTVFLFENWSVKIVN
jgi:hypothetical protein